MSEAKDSGAIARRMRVLRRSTGLTQRAFSDAFGLNRSSWSNYEGDTRRISLDEALKLCDGLGASLDWIYRGRFDGMPLTLAKRLHEIETQEIQGQLGKAG